ncbi:MAG: hypothetical protein ACFE9C_16295 [Candidatus Hodarchaeota archaeon]
MNFSRNELASFKGKLRVLYFTPFFTLENTKFDTYMANEVNSVVKNYPNIESLIYLVDQRKKSEIIKYNKRTLQIIRRSYKNILTAISHPFHVSISVISFTIFPIICVYIFNIIYKKLGITRY